MERISQLKIRVELELDTNAEIQLKNDLKDGIKIKGSILNINDFKEDSITWASIKNLVECPQYKTAVERISDISQLKIGVELDTDAENQLNNDLKDGIKIKGSILNINDFKEDSVTRAAIENLECPQYKIAVDWCDGLWYPRVDISRNTVVEGLGDPFSLEYRIAVENNGGSIFIK